eukprot:COSAG03_NODE_4179_length_1649_cov_6.017419_3_plen_74_part_00
MVVSLNRSRFGKVSDTTKLSPTSTVATDTQRERVRQRGRERQRAERQRGREAERQRGREAERQRDREAERSQT